MGGRRDMARRSSWCLGELSTAELQYCARKSTGINYSCAGRYDTTQAVVVHLWSTTPHRQGTQLFSWSLHDAALLHI